MNKKSLFRLLALAALLCAPGVQAQDVIKVNYQGAQPTISDLVTAFVSSSKDSEEEEECCANEALNVLAYVWERHLNNLPLEENESLTVDEKNGYVGYKVIEEYDGTENVVKIELCYWNEMDGKHKLFAYNVACFTDGVYNPGQFDDLLFYRYDNATRTMDICYDRGIDEVCEEHPVMHSFDLPRTGKNITVTFWYENGKVEKTLKWNGRRFTL